MMKLALGPLLYYWRRERVVDFYRDVCDWPVDIVYVGEVICSRRHELRAQDWLQVAESLAAAGKEVVLSSLALLESDADLRALKRLVTNGRFLVEANDMSAVNVAAEAHLPFVVGPHVNVYNAATLAVLHGCGAQRWVVPVETSRALLAQMQAERPAGLQTEVFAHGHLPLAFSARCFTARAHNLSKDACDFRCLRDEEGLLARTREGEPLFVLNGIQTQSARVYDLFPAVADLDAIGVDVLRVSPAAEGTDAVVRKFDARMRKGELAAEATARAVAPCDGFWHSRPGMEHVHTGSSQ